MKQDTAEQQPKAAALTTTTAPGGYQLALPSKLSLLAASASSRVLARAPSVEDGVKFSGGTLAALLAMRYAGSLRSACMVGLLSGLFAHSLYADVLRKKRRRRGDRRQHEEKEEKKEEDEQAVTDSSSS